MIGPALCSSGFLSFLISWIKTILEKNNLRLRDQYQSNCNTLGNEQSLFPLRDTPRTEENEQASEREIACGVET